MLFVNSTLNPADAMTRKERISATFALERPDRPPILGGWLAAPESVQAIAGCTEDEYWADTYRWGVEAEKALGSDALIGVFEPVSRDEYRCVDDNVVADRSTHSVESVLEEIEALPTLDQVREQFDLEVAYREFVEEIRGHQSACGDIVWCPADWKVIPHGLWYHEYGYEAAMLTLGLHPAKYTRLIQVSAEEARLRAMVITRAIQEGIMPRAFLTGEDLCSQEGPMVSPEFLRREYFPLLEYTLEPLVEVGARVVWHCDGAYQSLLDDVLACGVGGLQGFQQECGMHLEDLVQRRTQSGDPLVIFGAMSVTQTLPHGTPADVRAEVDRFVRVCRDNAALALFTSNTINPDVPVENIRAFWQAAQEVSWG